MSEQFREFYRAIQSYDDDDLRALIARLADATRRDNQTVECLIVDLKIAVNSLPANALRERGRPQLRDRVVRMAIDAYYEGADPSVRRTASPW